METTLQRGASKSLNSLIVEYFDHMGFEELTKKFLAECTSKGDPIPRKKSWTVDSPLKIWDKLRTPFETGDLLLFIQIWNAALASWRKKVTVNHREMSHLMFKIHVHFAVLPIRLNRSDSEKQEAMRRFKSYLDERKAEGWDIDQEASWLLPCYALPFVHDPEKHASFRIFFEDAWVEELVSHIQDFWCNLLPPELPRSEPKLLTIFKWHQHTRMKRQLCASPCPGTMPSKFGPSSEPSGDTSGVVQSNQSKDRVAVGGAANRDKSPKVMALRARKRMVETDLWRTSVEHWRDKKRFNQLRGIAIELCQVAKEMHKGAPVNVHLTLSNCVHIMPEIFSTEMREKRSALRLDNLPKSKIDPMGIIQDALSKMEKFNLSGEKEMNRFLRSPSYRPLFNYASIRLWLVTETPLKRALLLQALRWRITREPCPKSREKFVNELVEEDVLSLTAAQSTKCLDESALWDYSQKSIPKSLEQSQIRILCTLSSFPDGRNYLVEVEPVVVALAKKLTFFTGTTSDDFTGRDLAVATLQKLSLRKRPTDVMLREDILEWLLKLLDRARLLEAYVIEYSAALLMNLCMRKEGKQRFSRVAVHGLRVLMSLMDLEKEKADKIYVYIHGTLNAVLSDPSVMRDAQALHLEKHLRNFRNVYEDRGRQDLKVQADIILKTVYSSTPHFGRTCNGSGDVAKGGDDDDEDVSDYESVDEVRCQSLEDELDENDPVRSDPSMPHGDSLLSQFALPQKTKRQPRHERNYSKSDLPARPMTPRGVFHRANDLTSDVDLDHFEDGVKLTTGGRSFVVPNGVSGMVAALSPTSPSGVGPGPAAGRASPLATGASKVDAALVHPASRKTYTQLPLEAPPASGCRPEAAGAAKNDAAGGGGRKSPPGEGMASRRVGGGKANDMKSWHSVIGLSKAPTPPSGATPPSSPSPTPTPPRGVERNAVAGKDAAVGNRRRNNPSGGSGGRGVAPAAVNPAKISPRGSPKGSPRVSAKGTKTAAATASVSVSVSVDAGGELTYRKEDNVRRAERKDGAVKVSTTKRHHASAEQRASPPAATVAAAPTSRPRTRETKESPVRSKPPPAPSPPSPLDPKADDALRRQRSTLARIPRKMFGDANAGNVIAAAAARNDGGGGGGGNKTAAVASPGMESLLAPRPSAAAASGPGVASSPSTPGAAATGVRVSRSGRKPLHPTLPKIPGCSRTPSPAPSPTTGPMGDCLLRGTAAAGSDVARDKVAKLDAGKTGLPPSEDINVGNKDLRKIGSMTDVTNSCGGVPHYSLAGLKGFDPKDYALAFGPKPKIPRTPPGSVADMRRNSLDSSDTASANGTSGSDDVLRDSDDGDVCTGVLRCSANSTVVAAVVPDLDGGKKSSRTSQAPSRQVSAPHISAAE